MKTTCTVFLFFLYSLFFIACDKENNDETPVLPPVESMVINLDGIQNLGKSAGYSSDQSTMAKINWGYSALSVSTWSLLLTSTLAVPVASFAEAFKHSPVKTGPTTWQWSYSVTGFAVTYSARMVGILLSDDIKWEMYVKKEGVNPFNEFLWFDGTSSLDGKSGQWRLNHSAEFPEELLLIDWKKEGDEVAEVKYTYTREKNDQRQTDKFKGSYLTYGFQNLTYNAFVTIHAYQESGLQFSDAFIEWNRSNYMGRVKSGSYFNDQSWHCWDSTGNDVICP